MVEADPKGASVALCVSEDWAPENMTETKTSVVGACAGEAQRSCDRVGSGQGPRVGQKTALAPSVERRKGRAPIKHDCDIGVARNKSWSSGAVPLSVANLAMVVA